MHVRPFIPDEDEFRACYSSCYASFPKTRGEMRDEMLRTAWRG